MNVADTLLVPEWREHYIPFAELQNTLHEALAEVPELKNLIRNHDTVRRLQEPDFPLNQAMRFHTSSANFQQSFASSPFFTATFSGDASTSASTAAAWAERVKRLRMSVTTTLSQTLCLDLDTIRYRSGVGRNTTTVEATRQGWTPFGVERFEPFEGLLNSTEPTTPGPLNPTVDALNVVIASHQVNEALMEPLRGHVQRVSTFYGEKSKVLSAAAFAAIDRTKMRDQLNAREQDELDQLYRRVYFSLQMLQEYCDTNHLITCCLVDELIRSTNQGLADTDAFESLSFYSPPNSGPIALLRQEVCQQYAAAFCDGDRTLAVERLRLQHTRDSVVMKPRVLFEVGLLAGVVVGIGITDLVVYTNSVRGYVGSLLFADTDAYIFSAVGVIILLMISFSINVVIWEAYHVNYVYSLHLNPLRHFDGLSLLRDHLLFALVWVVVLLCFLYSAEEEALIGSETEVMARQRAYIADVLLNGTVQGEMVRNLTSDLFHHFATKSRSTLPSYVWAYLLAPVCLVVYAWQLLQGYRRGIAPWALTALSRILVTPYFPVEFPDFFICEQLVSISSTLFELQFVWCIFHSATVVSACEAAEGSQFFALLILPSFWRVLQSLRRYRDEPHSRDFYPHILNALKYLINCVAYTFSALKGTAKYLDWPHESRHAILALFIVLMSIDTVFKCWYELWIEFGVLRCHAKHFLIRDHILLPQWTYYVATFANIALRLLWITKYFSDDQWDPNAGWIFPVFAVLEVLRRGLWNVFRVEHDQVSNIEHYKISTYAPSAHDTAPTKALWDVHAEDVRKTALGLFEFQFMMNLDVFLKAVGRKEREALVEALRVATAPEDASAAAAAAAAAAGGLEAPTTPANSPVPTSRSEAIFVRDVRGNLKKTSLMLLLELPEEDRCRALLLRVGDDRNLKEYLQNLVDEGLDRAFLKPPVVATLESPRTAVRRNSSHHLRRPIEPAAGPAEQAPPPPKKYQARPSLLLSPSALDDPSAQLDTTQEEMELPAFAPMRSISRSLRPSNS